MTLDWPVNCRYFTVDAKDHHVLAHLGAIGELLIEGPALCRKYLDAPDLTAQAFLEDPIWSSYFLATRGSPFYRTGDLVRYTKHGSLEYIGRKDT